MVFALTGRHHLNIGLMALALLWLSGCGSMVSGARVTADSACAQLTDTGSLAVGSGLPGDPGAPEPASGYRARNLVSAKSYMVVSANPYASMAGCDSNLH